MVVRSLDEKKDPFRPREDNEELLGPKVPYLSAIGALMYLANCTIPDIAFSVNLLARYSSAPTKRHWNSIKHILRYLHGTTDMGLFYSKKLESQVVGYADVGYQFDPPKGRSQSGYVFTCGGAAISWRSVKQTLAATSSNHSEILALHEANRECIWLRTMIHYIRESCRSSSTKNTLTILYGDNAACITQIRNDYIKGDRMKHISPKFFYTHELQNNGDIGVRQIQSSKNFANLFTKALSTTTFRKMIQNIVMRQLKDLLPGCLISPKSHNFRIGFDRRKLGHRDTYRGTERRGSGDRRAGGGGEGLGGVIRAFRREEGRGRRRCSAPVLPTLLYNVVRNKIQTEFRWWDPVDQFLLLGAVPFPSDIPCLKQLGVSGVITLNEPYETLVPSSLYIACGIEHLVIPTRDYCFAPSFGDICKAVDFIHNKASCGKTTYVHCKAGRGRSTTIVLCYLVQHKQMTPTEAYDFVKSRRPRVLLASPQRQAVQEYYRIQVIKVGRSSCLNYPIIKSPALIATRNFATSEDSSFVLVRKSDLDGYVPDCRASSVWAELSLVYRVQFAGQAALASLSCFWLRCHSPKEMAVHPDNKLGRESCSLEDQLRMGHPYLVSAVVVKL